MSNNLEALVEVATGAHPVPEQQGVDATAADSSQAMAEGELTMAQEQVVVHHEEVQPEMTEVTEEQVHHMEHHEEVEIPHAAVDVSQIQVTDADIQSQLDMEAIQRQAQADIQAHMQADLVNAQAQTYIADAHQAMEGHMVEEHQYVDHMGEHHTIETPLGHEVHQTVIHEPNPVETPLHHHDQMAMIEVSVQGHEPNPVETPNVAEAVAAAIENTIDPVTLSNMEGKDGDVTATAAAVAAAGGMDAKEHAVSMPPLGGDLVKMDAVQGNRMAERRRKGWVKKTWEERLEELKAYKVIHGDANVPTLSKENPSLGHWVHDQRKQYRLFNEKKQTAMTPGRIEQLEAVGFKWALQRHTTMKSWNERFDELKLYLAEKGDCNVPIRYKENPSLGQWVSTQRQEYGARKKGKKSNITDERIAALEEIGFVWSLRDTSKMAPRKTWDAHFETLKEFKQRNGHCDVRVRSKQHPTGSLGRWVEKQRHHYNNRLDGRENKITDEQIAKLEDLGFKWRVRNEKRSVIERRAKLKAEHEARQEQESKAAEVTNAEEQEHLAQNVVYTVEGVEGQHHAMPQLVPHPMDAEAMAVEMSHAAVGTNEPHTLDAGTVAAMEAAAAQAVAMEQNLAVEGVVGVHEFPEPAHVEIPMKAEDGTEMQHQEVHHEQMHHVVGEAVHQEMQEQIVHEHQVEHQEHGHEMQEVSEEAFDVAV